MILASDQNALPELPATQVSHGESPRRVALFGPPDRAFALATADPHVHITVFAPDWLLVDAARRLVRLTGLEQRIAVHHSDAFRLTGGAVFDDAVAA